LWEGWKDPANDEWLHTCTIITGEPNEFVAQIHTLMPVILPEEDHAKWLRETEDGDLKALLKPFPADQMRIWPISPRVNSPKNHDPDIVSRKRSRFYSTFCPRVVNRTIKLSKSIWSRLRVQNRFSWRLLFFNQQIIRFSRRRPYLIEVIMPSNA
jgi:hypothetical protein